MRAREATEAIDRDLKAIAARAREADARRAELEKQYKLQVGFLHAQIICCFYCYVLLSACAFAYLFGCVCWPCCCGSLWPAPKSLCTSFTEVHIPSVAVSGPCGIIANAAQGCCVTMRTAAQGERASQAGATAAEKMKAYEQKKTVAEQADAYKKVRPVW